MAPKKKGAIANTFKSGGTSAATGTGNRTIANGPSMTYSKAICHNRDHFVDVIILIFIHYIMNKFLVEFLGTLFFLYVIIATGNALAIGAALAIAIMLGGKISGGNYNPSRDHYDDCCRKTANV